MDLTDLELPREAYELFARSKAEHAQESGSPVLMIEAILLAAEKKVSPPLAAVTFVIECFRRWHDSQATISLDEAFGVKPDNGKRHPYRKLLSQDRDEMLFMKVAMLKAFGAKTGKAVEMVTGGLEKHQNWNRSKWDLPSVEYGTLLRRYSKCPQRKQMEEEYRATLPKWSQEERRKFLSQFPSDSMPYRLKHEFLGLIRR